MKKWIGFSVSVVFVVLFFITSWNKPDKCVQVKECNLNRGETFEGIDMSASVNSPLKNRTEKGYEIFYGNARLNGFEIISPESAFPESADEIIYTEPEEESRVYNRGGVGQISGGKGKVMRD